MDSIGTPQEKTLQLGDTHDDDPVVLDSLVQQETEPPDVGEAISAALAPDYTPAVRPSRVITGTLTMLNTWLQPTCILQEDLNRKSITISVTTEDATDYINLADTAGLLSTDTVGRIYETTVQEILHGHTGPVWVTAAFASHGVEVSWWAVTE